MTKEYMLAIWKKAQQGQKTAKLQLIQMHNDIFPHHAGWANKDNMSQETLHTVFLNLEQIAKK